MTLLSFWVTTTFCRGVTTAFAPRNKTELHGAVDACLQLSPVGNCSAGPNGPIGSWDVSAVTSMYEMFAHAQAFNQDLSAWNVSAVTYMQGMFAYAQAFNQDLSAWDVSAVIMMQGMFNNAHSFNQDLSAWDVSAVIIMQGMFNNAHSFNQDLSAWNVSAVTYMQGMFYNAHSFNQDLSAWDVSAVTNMQLMFNYALSFNQDLSTWDVSAVTDMQGMFNSAKSFEHMLCGVSWVNSKARKDDMFTGSRGSISSTVCTTATTTKTTTTKAIIPIINTITTATTTTVSITVIAIICVAVAVVMMVRAHSQRSIGETNLSEIPLITTNSVMTPDPHPVFTSPTTETNLGTASMEEKGSNADPSFSALGANTSTTVAEEISSNPDQVLTSPTTETNLGTASMEEISSNADPVLTLPMTETNPNTTLMEEKSSLTDPVFTSQTDDTNPHAFTSPTAETDSTTAMAEESSSNADPAIIALGANPSTTAVEETSPNAGPVFTSPTAETGPSTTTVEEKSSSADPVFTSQTDDTNTCTTVVPLHERTFATSNYKRFYTAGDSIGLQHNLLSAVENVLTLYAKRIITDEQDKVLLDVDVMEVMKKIQDDAFKQHEAMKNDIEAMAEYLWTSCEKHRMFKDMELCSVLNAVIRDDVAAEIEAATIILRSINSRRVRRYDINAQSYPPTGETWRGGGFRREHRAFFERMIGKKYRVPGFLATSVRRAIAAAFAFKAGRTNPSHPCVIWRITFDPRGEENPEYRVKHMTLVSKTLVVGEHEYLFAPYSVFTLVSVEWNAGLTKPHEFTIRAARDNKEEDECLPLTPWY